MSELVSGLSRIVANLERLEVEMAATSQRATRKQAYKVVDRAKRNAPVLTGTLRASIDVLGESKKGEAFYITVGSIVKYAAFVEFGTVNMRAQPYLRPAIHEAEVNFLPGVSADLFGVVKTFRG